MEVQDDEQSVMNLQRRQDQLKALSERYSWRGKPQRSVILVNKSDEKDERWPPKEFVSQSSKYVLSAEKNELLKSMAPLIHPKIKL